MNKKPTDPLSNLLIISAIVLGMMYVLEERGRSELDDAELAASVLEIAGCTTHAVGQNGDDLGLRCTTSAEAAVAALDWSKTPAQTAWIEVGPALYRCGRDTQDIGSCQREVRQEKEKAHQ